MLRAGGYERNRVIFLLKMYEKIKGIKGALVECGVCGGKSLLFLASLAEGERDVYGFDSFEGLPEPTAEDRGVRRPKKGEMRIDYDSVQKKFDRLLLDVTLTKGFFNDTLPFFKAPIALLNIDCDIYQSYLDVLNNLYPSVVPGGVILFDEYNSKTWPGAKKAVDEFGLNPERDLETGKYFMIKP